MNVIAPGSTTIADLAQMANAQGHVLIGRPGGRLSMEKAQAGLFRAHELVMAGHYDEGLEELRAARRHAEEFAEAHPC